MRLKAAAGSVLAASALLAGAATAQNVSVTDYDVPVSKAERLLVDLTANHATKGSDKTASNGNVGAVYKRFYDSLPFGYSIDVTGSGSTALDPKTDEYESTYNADLSGSIKRYIWDKNASLKDIFGSARFDANMLKDYDQPNSSVTIALGYGRFINATGLAKAVRMEGFLIDENEITGNLPKDAMVELAKIVDRRGEYEDTHGATYKKQWYADMEEVIRKSGMLKEDAIGAVGILRMDEVIEREQIADRFYGWDLAVGSKFDLTVVDPTTGKEVDELPSPPLDVSAHYARPVAWEWQFNAGTRWSSPFDNLGKAYTGSAAADLTYELTNRVDFRARYGMKLGKIEDVDAEVAHSAGVALIYYIENQVNLVAQEQIEKAAGDEDATTNFTLTLNYRVF